MKTRFCILAFLGVLLCPPVGNLQAGADAFTYSTQRRPVRAGILVSRALNVGNFGPENTGTHLFYVLDSRTDLKPLGMEFVNPLAPPVVTADIYKRWRDRVRPGGYDPAFDSASLLSQVFRVGARVTKNMGAYWEVNLDNLSAEDLKQFDLLYIHTHKPDVDFDPVAREKLRKFVDGGGTLWVETAGGMTFARFAPFLFGVQFHNGPAAGAAAVVAAPNHPLLSYPHTLTPQEVQSLGDKGVGAFYVYNPYDPNNPGYYDTIAGQDALNPPAGHTLVPVVWNTRGLGALDPASPNPGWRPLILAGQVGAGRIVFSAQGSGDAINNFVGGWNPGWGPNSGAISGDLLVNARPADLKFAYNLAAWATVHTTPLTDVRRTGGTAEKVGAKLVKKWEARALGSLGHKVSGVALYRGLAYVVDGDLILHCFDTKPAQDLDGDGNPDDGAPDMIAGAPFDEVWRFNLKTISPGATGASTPTIIEFYDPNPPTAPGLASFRVRELVIVVLSDGTVVAVRALPRVAMPNFPLAAASVADWTIPPSASGAQPYPVDDRMPIPAAAWSEGVLFVSFNTAAGGRVAAIDPRRGNSAFQLNLPVRASPAPAIGAVPHAAGVPPFVSAPTVGYVLDGASGASDKVIYVYARSATAGITDSIQALWLGARGEPLTRTTTANTYQSRSTLPWYIYNAGGSNNNPLFRPRIFFTFRDPVTGRQFTRELQDVTLAGVPVPGLNQFMVRYTANQPVRVVIGQVQAPGMAAPQSPDTPGSSFHADYTLDWSSQVANLPPINARAVLNAPATTSGALNIGGSPALSPEDLLYFAMGGTAGAATAVLMAVNEQGGAKTTARWTYALHNGIAISVGGQSVQIPPRLRNVDSSMGLPLDYLYDLQFFGTPAYRNGVVYAVARGTVGRGGPPVSAVCAFRANPEFVLRLGVPIQEGTAVTINQPNLVNITGNNTALVQISPQQYTLDRASGVVRIHAMAPRGSIGNFISASLPFIVRIGSEERLIAGTQVDVIGTSRESRPIGAEGVDNLLWYAVIPAANWGLVSSSPSIQGDVLWLGTEGGFALSLDADPGANDPSLARGGQVRLAAINPGEVGHLRWVERVSEVGAPVLSAPVAAENTLLANAVDSIRAFEDAITLIADSKRLLEVNAAGDVVWSCDGTRSRGIAGGDPPLFGVDPVTGNVVVTNPASATGVPAVQKVSFARPTVARRIGINNLLVVDTGNHRVVQIDRGGNVVWEVNRLFDDFKRLLRPGDPLTLNAPTDCSYWTEFNPNIQIATVIDNVTYTYAGPATIVHYLIADTGNSRVIEVVDVYDPAGRPVQLMSGNTPAPFVMLRQVNFVSATYSLEGKKLAYRSAQRVVMRNQDLPPAWQDPNLPIRALTLAAISNYRLVSPGGPNNPTPINAAGDVRQSGGGSVVVLNEAGVPLAIVSNLRIPNGPGTFLIQPINTPVWFSKFDERDAQGNLIFKYLLVDANGCYQLRAGPDPTVLEVEWLLTTEDYYLMTGKRLRATSIRRLANGNYLITNQFSGEDNPRVFGIDYNTTGNPANGNILGSSEFRGEVFELNPSSFNLFAPGHGYQPDYVVMNNVLIPNENASIVWRSPREDVPFPGTIGVIRRSIGDPARATSTSVLEQPAYADRPF